MGVASKEKEPSMDSKTESAGFLTAWVQHVHGVIILVCEASPVCDWERFGEARDPGSKVILPHPNSPFGGVRAMYVQQCMLEGSLLRMDKVLHILQCFVVHLV